MRFLSGYDFFISYSRQDANAYALKVTNYLIDKGYSCYIDKWGTEPGKSLPLNLKSIIKNASILIIVGSPSATQSVPISEEIDIFLKTKRMIIPIDFGAIRTAIWWPKIEGLALTEEPLDSLTTNQEPGSELKQRIKGSFTYTRQSVRIKKFLRRGISVSVITLGLLIYMFLNIKGLNEEHFQLLRENKTIAEAKNDLIKKNKIQSVRNDSLIQSAIVLVHDITKNQKQLDSLNREMKRFATGNKSLVKLVMQDFTYRTVRYPGNLPVPFIITKEKPLTIYQHQDKLTLYPEAKTALDEFAQAWKLCTESPSIQIDTDYGGTYINEQQNILVAVSPETKADYLKKISQNFAQSIVDYLVKKGIPKNKLSATGYGNTRPVNEISLLNNRIQLYTLKNVVVDKSVKSNVPLKVKSKG
jgi:outer membrane protein OmpA-like peptidoglycan-associated protein